MGMHVCVDGTPFVVDDDDDDLVRSRDWRTLRGSRDRTTYLRSGQHRDGNFVLLHRLLLGPTAGMVVDHINGEGLDNRRANLRVCTQAENTLNRRLRRDSATGVKGVSWSKHMKMYRARVWREGKGRHLGYFSVLADAAAAVRTAREDFHGQFARHG